MSLVKLIALADAVSDFLNVQNLGFVSQRTYLPLVDMGGTVDEPIVYVSIRGEASRPATREAQQFDRRVFVGVNGALSPGTDDTYDNDEIDAYCAKVDAIKDALKFEEQTGLAWIGTENDPFLDHERLEFDRRFASLIVLHYRSNE